ncbi:MAG TPA: hypothetical protein GXX37_15030 [Clostridiaceae bacterium]|nr:hypothetical protein [Clostridiaceae bacterium]
MEYLKRFPYMLAIFMSLLVGIISYISNIEKNEIYTRMIACIIVFYFIGLFIRYFVCSLQKDIQIKVQDEKTNNKSNIRKSGDINTSKENDENEWTNLHETVEKVGE